MQNSVPSGVTKHLLLFLLTLNHSVHRKLQETEDSPQAHVSPGGTGPCLCSPHRSCFSSIVSSRGVKPFPFIFSSLSLAPRTLLLQAQVPRLRVHLSVQMVLGLLAVFRGGLSLFCYFFLWLCWVLVAAHTVFTGSCAIFCFCGADSLVVLHGLACPVACGILVPQTGIEPMSSELQDIDSEPLDPSPNRDGTHVL